MCVITHDVDSCSFCQHSTFFATSLFLGVVAVGSGGDFSSLSLTIQFQGKMPIIRPQHWLRWWVPKLYPHGHWPPICSRKDTLLSLSVFFGTYFQTGGRQANCLSAMVSRQERCDSNFPCILSLAWRGQTLKQKAMRRVRVSVNEATCLA